MTKKKNACMVAVLLCAVGAGVAGADNGVVVPPPAPILQSVPRDQLQHLIDLASAVATRGGLFNHYLVACRTLAADGQFGGIILANDLGPYGLDHIHVISAEGGMVSGGFDLKALWISSDLGGPDPYSSSSYRVSLDDGKINYTTPGQYSSQNQDQLQYVELPFWRKVTVSELSQAGVWHGRPDDGPAPVCVE